RDIGVTGVQTCALPIWNWFEFQRAVQTVDVQLVLDEEVCRDRFVLPAAKAAQGDSDERGRFRREGIEGFPPARRGAQEEAAQESASRERQETCVRARRRAES